MPYIQPGNSGDDESSPPPPHHKPRHRRATHGRRGHHAPRKTSPKKKARAAHPAVPATDRAPLGAAGDPWHGASSGLASGLAPEALLDLSPDAGLSSVILELVGAERATLGSALVAWQREQDRLLNRAWRRPGGLARPGGI